MKADATTDSDERSAPSTDTVPPTESSSDVPQLLKDERQVEFQILDARSVGLTRFVNAVTFAVIGIGALVGGSILLWFVPFPWKLIFPLVWLAIGGVSALSVVWWPRWEHDRWSYRVGENVVELRHGVYWHVAVAIPLSRLQHIDLHRGPLERKWGLASLQLHTAGTRNASHQIPGLDTLVASNLRDHLIAAANRGSHERAND